MSETWELQINRLLQWKGPLEGLQLRSRLTAITSHVSTKQWPWNKVGLCILSSGQFVSPISLQFLQSVTVISSLLIRDWCVSCSQLVVSYCILITHMWALRRDMCCIRAVKKTGSSSRISSNNINISATVLSELWRSDVFIYGYEGEGTDTLLLFNSKRFK